jgi:hypothetical protein
MELSFWLPPKDGRKCKKCGKALAKRVRRINTGYCQICRLKILHPQLGKKRPDMVGNMKSARYGINNRAWKGDNVGYVPLHLWVKRQKGSPKKCELCGKDGLTGRLIHWANKSGKYLRDVDDWIRLCAKCHFKYDNKNFQKNETINYSTFISRSNASQDD